MSILPVNLTKSLAIQTSFGQENPKFHAENSPTSVSDSQIVRNLEDKIAVFLQKLKLPKIQVGGRVIKIVKYSFGSLEYW